MGKSIQELLESRPDVTVQDFKEQEIDSSLPRVVIDFSSPDCLPVVLQACLDQKLPLITGTTGFSKEHHSLINRAQAIIPILVASNMSIGIANLKQSINFFLQTSAGPFTCQITEMHHANKIDSPSGTAIEIMRFLEEFLTDKISASIKVKALRLGKIFGIHRVEFNDGKESFCFQHIAHSRNIFARGAVNAAQWISVSAPGIYTFDDFLAKKL
jgi:4-hydroxy-tetrahydrodipicolinate reductase